MSRRGVTGVAALALLMVAAPASAAPMRNGRIVYERVGGTVGKCPVPRNAPECETDAQLYSVRVDGRHRRRVDKCSIEFGDGVESRLCGGEDPSWSPSGRRLAFTGLEVRGSPFVKIADLRGDEDGRLYPSSGSLAGEAAHPTWSPDGRRLAFTAAGPNATSIQSARSDASHIREITAGPFDSHPAWSSKGVIAFERAPSFEDAEGDLYAVHRAGGSVTRLTFRGGQDPDWSPDARRLAFTRVTNGAMDIYVMRADGTGVRRLTRDGDSGEPAWSPDARRIAYVRRDSIYTMSPAGKRRRLVARPAGSDSLLSPDWRPLPKKKKRH